MPERERAGVDDDRLQAEYHHRCRTGELDLIVRRGRTFVFCEVKTRSSAAFGAPVETVTREKQVVGRSEQLSAPHATVVNAGVMPHPTTGEDVVAFVAVGGTRKLAHLRADPTITVVVRAGWQWAPSW